MSVQRDPDPQVSEARQGETGAQQRLIEACGSDLDRFLSNQMGPRIERAMSLSDLRQETFLRAFKAIDRLPEDASLTDFRRHLYRHGRWVALEAGRKMRDHFGESAADEAGGLDRPDPAASETGAVTRDDELRWLGSLIGQLDPKHAEVLRLRLENRSFIEIGERIGITEDAARKRYFRAAARLARQRERGPGDGEP